MIMPQYNSEESMYDLGVAGSSQGILEGDIEYYFASKFSRSRFAMKTPSSQAIRLSVGQGSQHFHR